MAQPSAKTEMKRIRLLTILTIISAFAWCTRAAEDPTGELPKFDKAPVPKVAPPPVFPAAMDGIKGIVSVTLVIDETGAVTKATVAKSTHPEFEQPSLDAVTRWKFKPAEKEGQPVRAQVTIPLHFNPPS
jgi:periplasmic protein TonB